MTCKGDPETCEGDLDYEQIFAKETQILAKEN